MLKKRLSEPSTWAGLATLIITLTPPQYAAYGQGLAAMFGGLATILAEKGPGK